MYAAMQIDQRVSYAVSLADLCTLADCACDVDSLQFLLAGHPDQQASIAAMVDRMHSIIERAAGSDAHLIYAPDDGSTQ